MHAVESPPKSLDNPVQNQPGGRPSGADLLKRRLMPSATLQLVPESSTDRPALEHYIARQFVLMHNARIEHFMPTLLTLNGADGICATVGVTVASDGPLFLEQYLDQPVENAVNALFQLQAQRKDIVEIGNLVSSHRGSSQLLFTLLTTILHRAGYRWVAFTATQKLARIIAKSHFTPKTLCRADPARLIHGSAAWGSYYDDNPQVMLGDLEVAAQQTASHPLLQAVVSCFEDDIALYTRQINQANLP